jgi:hypothetical protein
MANQTYKLTYQITANAQQAEATLKRFREIATKSFPLSQWFSGREFEVFKSKMSTIGSSLRANFLSIGTNLKSLFFSIPSVLFSGFTKVKNLIGGIVGMVRSLALGALKWGGIGLGATAGLAYTAQKIMRPAATDEERIIRLRANKMDEMLPYFRKFALVNSQQGIDSLISSAITLKNQGLDPKKYLQILSDTSIATGRSLEDLTHTLAVIKSGNVLGAFRQLTELGISKLDLAKQGIKFEQMPTGEYEIKSDIKNRERVFNSIIATLSGRYSGTSAQMSETLTDKINDLKDQLAFTISDLTKQFLPAAKSIVDNMTVLIKALGSEEGRNNIISAFKESWNIFVKGVPGILMDVISSLVNAAVKMVQIISGWFYSGEAWTAFKKLGLNVYQGFKEAIVGARTIENVEKEIALAKENLAWKPSRYLGITWGTELNEKQKNEYRNQLKALEAERAEMLSTPGKYVPAIDMTGILVTNNIKKVFEDIGITIKSIFEKEKERQTKFDELTEYFGKGKFTDVLYNLNEISSANSGTINGVFTNPQSVNDALLNLQSFKSEYTKLDKTDQNSVIQNMSQFQEKMLTKLERIAQMMELNKIMSPKFIINAPDFTY